GHGAYTRSGSRMTVHATPGARELENCGVIAAAPCNEAYDAVLVQALEQPDSVASTIFDDVVIYKLKGSLVMGAREGQADSSQGLFATWSQSLTSGSYLDITAMTTVHNDLPNSTFAGGTFTVGTGEDGWYMISAYVGSPNAGDEIAAELLVNGT